MSKEYSAGAVIFRRENNQILYLLLHYQTTRPNRGHGGHWDFPKGHIEEGETHEQTVRREIEEETGLKDIEIVEGFKETIKYFFQARKRRVFKTVVFFLAETREKEIKISPEHTGFKWLPFKEAEEQMTYKNGKRILENANAFIIKNLTRFQGGVL